LRHSNERVKNITRIGRDQLQDRRHTVNVGDDRTDQRI